MKRKIKLNRILILLLIVFTPFGIFTYIFTNNDQEVIQEETSFYDLSKFQYKNGLMTYTDTNYTCITGIDVSSHNGSIDWNQVAKDDISFAIIRAGYRGASEGTLYTDELFETNINGAIAAGLDVGVYFYSSAINEQEIDEEVNLVLDLVKNYSLQYPIVFDMEHFEGGGRIDNLTQDEKTNLALRFCSKIEKAGYTAMIYGNLTWLYEDLDFDQVSAYPIWYAGYSGEAKMEDEFKMWQYSNQGSVAGISTNVDMNLYLRRKYGN